MGSAIQAGSTQKYIRLIIKIKKNTAAKVKAERLRKTFEFKKGVRQGDSLSPKFFPASLEHVFQNHKVHHAM